MKKFLYGVMISIVLLSSMLLPVSAVEEVVEPESIEEAGTYFVELYVINEEGNKESKIIKLTIRFPNTVLNEVNGEGIDAHDIQLVNQDITSLTDEDYIHLSGAHAWDLETGKRVAITTVVFKTSKFSGADYDVTFQTEKGTSITIQLYLFDEGYMYLSDHYFHFEEVRSSSFIHYSYLIIISAVIPLILISISFYLIGKKIENTKKVLYKK